MACSNPLKGFKLSDGSVKIKRYDFKPNSFIASDQWYFTDCVDEFIIPCGKCEGCLLNRSRQWAERCMLESTLHSDNTFLTLTYDDEHLDIIEHVDNDTGEISRVSTLCKRDLQLFLKRLRRSLDVPIRFYAAGEYGGSTRRPHYHMIVFGWKPVDLIFYKKSKTGFNLYNSPFLDSVWNKGYVVVGDFSMETASYVARYVTKKAGGYNRDFYSDMDIEPEFNTMSRNPGIGSGWFDDSDNRWKYSQMDFVSIPSDTGAKRIYKNRYFDSKLQLTDSEFYDNMKLSRRTTSDNINLVKETLSSLPFDEQCEVDGEVLHKRTRALRRDKI